MYKDFQHVMVDIETLGETSNSVILSIAAIEFDINTGNTGREFSKSININSCLDAGLHITEGTILWWFGKSEEARQQVINAETVSLMKALSDFSCFVYGHQQIWGNSNRFDLGILADAYRKIDFSIPWDFRNERDVRTLVSLAPQFKENHIYTGVKHIPLDDCKNQVQYVVKTYKHLLQC